MAPGDYQRRRLVEWVVAEITRASGRRYVARSIMLSSIATPSVLPTQTLTYST
jgi:hypothetical protein